MILGFKNKARIKIVFSLTKKDSADMDCDVITNALGITPTKISPPKISRGRISKEYSKEEIERDMPWCTIISGDSLYHKYIVNGAYSFESPEMNSIWVDQCLNQFEKSFEDKDQVISRICEEYGMYADLIIKLYGPKKNFPYLEIPKESVEFWGKAGASIRFEFL